MITFDYHPTAVNKLLNKLVATQNHVFWNIRSSYSNGQEQTLLEIAVYEGDSRRIKGLIVYNTETGQTVNLRYRGYKSRCNENIVDTLLDLINFEKYKMLDTV